MAVGDKHFLETGLQKSKRQKDKQGKMNRTTQYQNKKRIWPSTLHLQHIMNIGYYPIFRVNPIFRVLPDISGIANKRKTIPSSGALLWEPQKGPQGAKKCKICHFNVKYDCGTPLGWTIIVQDL